MAKQIGQVLLEAGRRHSRPQHQSIQTPTVQLQNASEPSGHQCPDCGGVRWLRYDVEVGHPSFGKVMPCPACNKDAVAISTGLNQVEREIRFSDIDTDGRPGAAKMITAARQFMADGCAGFLTVHGGYGNAKSTLLKAIVNECVIAGLPARYITMTEVMAYAREAFESLARNDTDYGRITELARVQVLVIDELDKARTSEYAREVQAHLFDVRYRNRHSVGTVVAWNGGFRAIDLPSVLSRLSEFVVVENTDPDMRPLLGGNS